MMNIYKTYANDNGLGIWITVLYGEPEKIRKFSQYNSIKIDDTGEITTSKSIPGSHLGDEVVFDTLDENLRQTIAKRIEEEELAANEALEVAEANMAVKKTS